MRRVAKFRSLPGREKKLLCEAGILLSLSNVCVKAIAFKHIDSFLRAHWNDELLDNVNQNQEIGLVQRSISRAARLLPWKCLCLSRSIAEFIMLRRRNIPAVLFTGVRFSDHFLLDAHAWVETSLVNDERSQNPGYAPVIEIGTRALDS